MDKLQGFVGKDTESINDVISTMLTNFVIFSYPEVIWCLQLNPHKASPMDLNDGETCIDLAIEQSMLSTYGVLMKIITMGMLFHAERYFKDEDERNTLIIIDEASRVGALSSKGSFDVAGAQATMRSRHCGIIQIFQTLDQIEKLYGSEVSKILISLSEARIFLTGDGLPSATEMVASMAGEYRTARRSYDKKGIAGTAADTSYNDEYRKIVNGEAMLNLRQRREFIGILYGVYIRAKKYVYFECPILGPIYRDIESYNEHERDVKKEKEKLIKKNIKESGGN